MIDILIPVLNRPQRAGPLVENILRSTVNDHRITFICSPSDKAQKDAVHATGANWMVVAWQPGPGDYARKINYGFSQGDWVPGKDYSPEFVFLGADDLCFCQGWDVHALATADASKAGVIGTDDLGNALVQAGDHSTHSLVRRSYIAERGGTFEGVPGVVYHEGYDHQYVDNELVAVAKHRGQWAFSHGSKVEHLHNYWGKSEHDSTYAKAMRASAEDASLFHQRRRQFS